MVQTKQIRHCPLIRMLCCPARFPANASNLFPGGDLKSRSSLAAFSIVSLRSAAAKMFANRATRFPSNNALVSWQAKDRIIIVGFVAADRSSVYRLPINDKQKRMCHSRVALDQRHRARGASAEEGKKIAARFPCRGESARFCACMRKAARGSKPRSPLGRGFDSLRPLAWTKKNRQRRFF